MSAQLHYTVTIVSSLVYCRAIRNSYLSASESSDFMALYKSQSQEA